MPGRAKWQLLFDQRQIKVILLHPQFRDKIIPVSIALSGGNVPNDIFDLKFQWPSSMKEKTGDKIKEACDMYVSEDKEFLLESIAKLRQEFDKAIEMIPKFYIFKNWILTPAFSVWIKVVSVTGIVGTGILLLLHLFNFVAQFSKIPWNFFEMAFCAVMSFFYFTCGLFLFINGTKFTNEVTKYLFPNIDYYLTYGTAIFCCFGVIVYGFDAIVKLIKLKNNELTMLTIKF